MRHPTWQRSSRPRVSVLPPSAQGHAAPGKLLPAMYGWSAVESVYSLPVKRQRWSHGCLYMSYLLLLRGRFDTALFVLSRLLCVLDTASTLGPGGWSSNRYCGTLCVSSDQRIHVYQTALSFPISSTSQVSRAAIVTQVCMVTQVASSM